MDKFGNSERDAASSETVAEAVANLLAGRMTEKVFIAVLREQGVLSVDDVAYTEFHAEHKCIHVYINSTEIIGIDENGEVEAF